MIVGVPRDVNNLYYHAAVLSTSGPEGADPKGPAAV